MATGDTLIIWTPQGNEPPSSNFATLDLRNLHPVLDFDSGTDESAVFSGVMPRHYGGGGIIINMGYLMTSATASTVVWDMSFERIGIETLDIDGDSFAAVNSTTAIVPSTTGHVGLASIAFTDGADMDSVAAGEVFRFKVTRDANSASDVATGDAELRYVEIKET